MIAVLNREHVIIPVPAWATLVSVLRAPLVFNIIAII